MVFNNLMDTEMKNIILYITILFCLSACELTEVLDQDPPNNLEPNNVLTDQASAENLLNGSYSFLNSRDFYLNTEGHPGLLSGSMAIRTFGESTFEANDILVDGNGARAYWTAFYQFINAANIVITLVDRMPDGAIDAERKKEIIAEAHFLRAFGHFNALAYYGQFYDPTSELGIIIRSEIANFQNRSKSRSSVEECYQFILDDLDVAIADAPDFFETIRASKTAAKALKARVLLYKGDYAEAAALANEVIQDGTRNLAATFQDVFDAGYDSEEMIFMAYADENTLSTGRTRTKTLVYGGRRLIASDYLQDTLASDPRATTTFNATNGAILKVYDTDNFSPTYFIRLAEMYLIAAEGLTRSGATLESSKEPLEALRSRAFGSPQVSTASSSNELLDEIYNEIIAELVFENGSEWFAGIRFDNISEVKPTVTSSDKYILPIPLREIESNFAIDFEDQNPGYTQ